jgi:hypothetical protein
MASAMGDTYAANHNHSVSNRYRTLALSYRGMLPRAVSRAQTTGGPNRT